MTRSRQKQHHLLRGLTLGSWILLAGICTAAAQALSTPVSVVKAAKRSVYEEVPYSGDVETRRRSRLSPKVNGFVAVIHVEEGDEVQAGDKLLSLDPDLARVALRRTAAELEEARARQREASRLREEAAELVRKEHIASTAYEATKSEVEISAAVVERLQAEYQREQINLSRHTVLAPFDGLIAEKMIEVGQWVETGDALFELVEIDRLRIEVAISQRHFARIPLGAPATITFDSLPERRFEGSVSVKIPMGQDSTRTFPARIDLSNADRLVAPGMSARIRIRLGHDDDSMLLPRDAVIRKSDGSESVWLLEEHDGVLKVKAVPVETGRAFGDNVEVLNGAIVAGDRVVLRGNERLRPEQVVHITEEVELNPR